MSELKNHFIHLSQLKAEEDIYTEFFYEIANECGSFVEKYGFEYDFDKPEVLDDFKWLETEGVDRFNKNHLMVQLEMNKFCEVRQDQDLCSVMVSVEGDTKYRSFGELNNLEKKNVLAGLSDYKFAKTNEFVLNVEVSDYDAYFDVISVYNGKDVQYIVSGEGIELDDESDLLSLEQLKQKIVEQADNAGYEIVADDIQIREVRIDENDLDYQLFELNFSDVRLPLNHYIVANEKPFCVSGNFNECHLNDVDIRLDDLVLSKGKDIEVEDDIPKQTSRSRCRMR